MRIARHVSELIGNTPLVQLNSVVPAGSGVVAAKIEYLNPGGSAKDRRARALVADALERGVLGPGLAGADARRVAHRGTLRWRRRGAARARVASVS